MAQTGSEEATAEEHKWLFGRKRIEYPLDPPNGSRLAHTLTFSTVRMVFDS